MNEKEVLQTMAFIGFANKILSDSKPMPPEIARAVNEHFWELVDEEPSGEAATASPART
jgi:hypothetical protein